MSNKNSIYTSRSPDRKSNESFEAEYSDNLLQTARPTSILKRRSIDIYKSKDNDQMRNQNI